MNRVAEAGRGKILNDCLLALTCLLLCLGCATSAEQQQAEFEPHLDSQVVEDPIQEASPPEEASQTTYKNRLTVLPIVGYTPETDMMWGVLFIGQYKPGGTDTVTRASNANLSLMYTNNLQTIIELSHTSILPGERLVLPGRFAYRFYPEKYWDAGRDQVDEAEQNIAYQTIELEQAMLLRLSTAVFFGPKLRLKRVYELEFADRSGEVLDRSDLLGAEGFQLGGFGMMLQWDQRDSIVTPSQKHFMSLSYMNYPKWSETQTKFRHWRLDMRKYFDLWNDRQSIIGMQFLADSVDGDPPFLELPKLGGGRMMRGYYEGRFRDRQVAQVQAEWRQQVFGPLGIAVFAAAGDVWSASDKDPLRDPKWSGGAGFRYNLNKDDPLNIRLDFGIGENTGGTYLTIAEAF